MGYREGLAGKKRERQRGRKGGRNERKREDRMEWYLKEPRSLNVKKPYMT